MDALSETAASAAVDEHSLSLQPCKDLTDVGCYAYGAIYSYALHQLYENDHDKPFITSMVNALSEHLKLNQQVQSAMVAIAQGLSGLESAEALIASLKSEELIKKRGCEVIIHDVILLSIKNGGYDARMRILVKYLCMLLHVSWVEAQRFEDAVMDRLKEEEHVPTEEETKEIATKAKKAKIKRYALIGLATVGGGTLIGLTGGLAAPLLAAGAGAVIGGAGAAALGTTAGVAIIGSLFGVAGAGLTGYKMKKRVGGVEEFEFEPLTEGRQLHITLAVCGWLNEDMPDFRQTWRCLSHSQEQYVLRWESKYLKELGKAMDYLYRFAINAAAQEALKYTILSGILAAVVWPATLLGAANVIDNPWSVCTSRATVVGKHLASVLLSRQQGKRPVTLIGFSLGARVIFYCLEEMAKSKHCQGIIEDVVLLGAPVTGNPSDWQKFSKVVAGRIVNGYCRGDWLLKFVYRTASVQLSIAGLGPIKWHDRRMHNMDLSDVVSGHLDYLTKIKDILEVVGVPVKEVPRDTSTDSLRKWVQIQKQSTSAPQLVGSAKASSVSSGQRGPNAKYNQVPKSSTIPEGMYHATGGVDGQTGEILSVNEVPSSDAIGEKILDSGVSTLTIDTDQSVGSLSDSVAETTASDSHIATSDEDVDKCASIDVTNGSDCTNLLGGLTEEDESCKGDDSKDFPKSPDTSRSLGDGLSSPIDNLQELNGDVAYGSDQNEQCNLCSGSSNEHWDGSGEANLPNIDSFLNN